MATILLIDDDPATLEVINACLQPQHQTRIATRGMRGLELARVAPQPDLILLDLELPDIHGFDVCRTLKRDPATAHLPVIFLSSHSKIADITQGLEYGAVDYVPKPVTPPILLARVRTHLRLRDAQQRLYDKARHLETLVRERTRDLEETTRDLQESHELTIVALGSLAETRDNETGNHIHRTREYVRLLVDEMRGLTKYRSTIATSDWDLFWKSAPLHDIGKVGIPDHVLMKPAPLTAAEYEIMKQHTVLGRRAILAAEQRASSRTAFLRIAGEIAQSHHERWNGGGYPEGLGGESIPLSARLMAVADVYDALISARVYKKAIPHADAVLTIRDLRGRQFDPDAADCFIALSERFDTIAQRYSDAETNGASSASHRSEIMQTQAFGDGVATGLRRP